MTFTLLENLFHKGLLFLKGHAGSFMAIRLSNIVLQFSLCVIGLRYLPLNLYGLWITCLALSAIISAIDFGLGNAIFSISANSRYTKKADLAAYIATHKIIVTAVVASLIVLPIVFYTDLPLLIKADADLDLVRIVLAITFIFAFASIPVTVLNQLYYGRCAAVLLAPLTIVGNVLTIFLSLTYSHISPSVNIYIFLIISLSLPLLFQILALRQASFNNSFFRFKWRNPKKISSFKLLKSQSFSFLLIQLSSLGYTQILTVQISSLLSTADVSIYSLNFRLYSLIATFLTIYLSAKWPLYVHLRKNHGSSALYNAFRITLLSSIAFNFLGCLLIYAFSTPLYFWMSGGKIPANEIMLLLFSLFSTLNAVVGNISILLNSLNCLKAQVIIATASSMIGLSFSGTLIGLFHIYGAVLSGIVVLTFMTTGYSALIFFIRKKRLFAELSSATAN